jgi:hypothetical protein
MKVYFEKSGGPFSSAPPVGEAFLVTDNDVKSKTEYEVTSDAFELLKNCGARAVSEKKVKDNPAVKDKKRAEKS